LGFGTRFAQATGVALCRRDQAIEYGYTTKWRPRFRRRKPSCSTTYYKKAQKKLRRAMTTPRVTTHWPSGLRPSYRKITPTTDPSGAQRAPGEDSKTGLSASQDKRCETSDARKSPTDHPEFESRTVRRTNFTLLYWGSRGRDRCPSARACFPAVTSARAGRGQQLFQDT